MTLARGAAADDETALDAYLSRLGLMELRLHLLERQLGREANGAKRVALGKQVVDAYAEELNKSAENAERFEGLRTRVERLLAEYPAARSANLDVALLQADYQRAEALIIAGQEDSSEAAKLNEARGILERIGPALSSRQAELAEAVDKAEETIDALKTEATRQAAEKDLARLRTLASRAEYFAGWAAYYAGVTREDVKSSGSDFAEAKQHFTRLLEITDEGDYELVEPDGLSLESTWRSRAVIGLALSEFGLGRVAAGERVLSWLNQSVVTPAIRDQAKYWHLQGLVNARRWSEARELAAREAAALTSSVSPGKSSFCITAVRAGAGLDGELQRALVVTGLRGLARMRQFEALDKLIEKHKLLEGELAGEFVLLWLRGRREYLTAERTKDAAGFRAAAETLQTAVELPAEHDDANGAGQARYYLGWAKYRLDELDAASQLFREAARVLRLTTPDLAAQAAWMQCTCLVRRAERDKRQATAAIAALAAFKQDFPMAEEAARVELLVTRLRQSDPDQTLRELARIRPGEPTYAAAQLEICQLRHQLWSKAKSDATRARPLAAELVAATQKLLADDRQASADERVKGALLAVDALRSGVPLDWKQIAGILDQVNKDAKQLEEASAARVEYVYRRLELAEQRGEMQAVGRAADWIARYGVGTTYELPALIIVARAAEQAVAGASGEARRARIEEAGKVFERLVRLLGESPATLATNRNALAAAAKLAWLDEEQGRWPEAAERLQRLVEAQPRDQRLLRRAGLACFQAGQYERALSHWRTLLGGLESGSEEWLEAKYFQIACLKRTDNEAAKRVLGQFRVLYPEVKSAAWRERFAQLGSK